MMVFLELVKAEYMFVYGDVFRRKSLLAVFVLYPYVLTLFVLLIGSALGSPQVFAQRVGVNPAEFFIVASFIMMSVMGVSDDILWRPIYDSQLGTLPYIIASPVSRIALYVSIPIPRLTLVLILGATSVFPVLTYFEGLDGIIASFAILGVAALGGLMFATFSTFIAGLIHSGSGESWRAINVVRPLIMIFIGAFYPRFMMPLTAQAITWFIPSSHAVEVIDRILIFGPMHDLGYVMVLLGIGTALALLYAPLASKAIALWEGRKLRSGGVKA